MHVGRYFFPLDVALILLKNFRDLFRFCIYVDIDEMLLLDKHTGLGVNSFRAISLCKSLKGILVSASYLAK